MQQRCSTYHHESKMSPSILSHAWSSVYVVSSVCCSNSALLRMWTVGTWRVVTLPLCTLLQATTVWPWWSTCYIMELTYTLKTKGTCCLTSPPYYLCLPYCLCWDFCFHFRESAKRLSLCIEYISLHLLSFCIEYLYHWITFCIQYIQYLKTVVIELHDL